MTNITSAVTEPTPLDEAVGSLASADTSLSNRIQYREYYRPEDYGAVPGGADCTKAFTAMMADLESKLVTDAGGSGVPLPPLEVLLTGQYFVSGPIMVAKPGRAQGLTFRGLGKRTSEIVMTAAANLFINQDRWMNVRFYDMSFRSTNNAANFLYSYSTGNAQDWVFTNVEWRGTWNYGIGLDGNNCNSEFGWNNCFITGSYENAYLYGGMTPSITQEDQFVNYWFNDCKVEYTYGEFIRMDRGGFIKVQGGSYILEGQRPNGTQSRFFYFPVFGHADSVMKLAVRDVRFELRNSLAQVIYSKWNGHIVFDNISDTALGFETFSNTLIAHEYDFTSGGAVVSYVQCDLVGKHAYHTSTTALGRSGVVYDLCTRKNNRTAAIFLALDGATVVDFIYRNDMDGIS